MGSLTKAVVLVVAIAAIAGCAEPHDAFQCTASSQCAHEGETGTCEPSGYCSFHDRACPSGQRYGELASTTLAGQCVVNPSGEFDVASAVSVSHTSIAVTFSAPPDPTAAVALANYAVGGLTLTGTPVLAANTVTFVTSEQADQDYTITASNISRASDSAPLWMGTATFKGRSEFSVVSATSLTNGSMQVTFSSPPDPTTAAVLASYSIPGLSLSATPIVVGNTVTLLTSPQSEISYTITVSGVVRAVDMEPLGGANASFTGRLSFNVASAASLNSRAVSVTFDAPPNVTQATTLANYAIPGLTLSGVPVVAGNTVTIATSAQAPQSYVVTVSNVTRASDGEPLLTNAANFTGISTFNVASAAATTSRTMVVTFDTPPNPTEATTLANYTVPGLSLSGTPTLSGNSVTITTSAQSASSYTVTVMNVTRASDAEPLTVNNATFTGRAPFNVASAVALSSTSVRITFDAAPNPTQATTLSRYSIPGLTLSGTPVLASNTVTITTSQQSNTTFTVTVNGVTRASDGEALTTTAASFTGRPPFNVISAAATSSTSFTVTFDAAPNAAQATTLSHYSVTGLTLSGTPVLAGNTVTITTSPQTASNYAVVVSGVTRSSDAEALTVASAAFTGRAPFNVASAASANNVAITVTFNGPPNVAQATTLSRYSVPGLTLSGTPVLNGNTVTITTSAQSVTTYTVTVSGVTRASDGELLTNTSATFTGKTGFNVSSAASLNTTTMSVTFDAPPNVAQATTVSNYSVAGLTLSGTPTLSGNTVTITTSPQPGGTFTVVVSNVTRASDASPLAVNSASFTHTTFNVASAASLSTQSIRVTYDAPPNAAQATTLANYNIAGLVLSGTPVLSGNTVTITTSNQSATTYTVNVSGVTRGSDGTVLSNGNATFTGRAPFSVATAASTSSGTMSVTFTDAPVPAQATTLANYSVPGLTLSGPLVLAGNTVTLTTTAQAGTTYTVTVSNVTRASDSEPLTTPNASFAGTALQTPTVTNVVVLGTSPNNGTKFFNTGTATVVITGTDFTGVSCPTGVTLDDLNGGGAAQNTQATSCTVDSGTQITATFPAGIRTNGTTGWNVRVTNAVGTNTTSTVKLVTYAGLLLSEVFTGKSGGGGTTHEYIEIYNATNNALNMNTIGLQLHLRSAAGADTVLPLTYLRTTVVSHGYFLLVSTDSKMSDVWYTPRDAEYNSTTAELVDNGGCYVSLSSTANLKVLDKAGWGSQVANGFEGTAMANMPLDTSSQRKPAGGAGAATDTDVNLSDFLAPTASITPLNSLAPPEP